MNEFVDFNSARSAREVEKDRISECCRLLTRAIFDMRDLGADNEEVRMLPRVVSAAVECVVRKPALHLSDIVRKRVHPIIGWGISARAAICSTVLSGQAPKPLSGAPKARGLTAKARIERSWMLPRSDTV